MNDKIKILYVDDERINIEVFKITFSKEAQIFVAESGIEGLEILRANPEIEFVISDMKMPQMDGLEFIREVKKINKELPCVLLSGYQQTQEMFEALNNGTIVSYMTKPFNKKEIVSLIENTIDG